MKGTTPPGTSSEPEAARWVREMFAGVATSYDLLNHLLSFNLDRHWRRHTVRRVSEFLSLPGARVLDICCGTGDLTLALGRAAGGRLVFGSDFCHPMVIEAARKAHARRARNALFEADALALPVASGSLDLITVAFGLRNFSNYESGLREMYRVLKPGGAAAILEFSQPPNRVFAKLYKLYSMCILPAIGGMVSGSRDAYQYLPESVRKFPGAEALADRMREAGFTQVSFDRMTCGIVALHVGVRGKS